MTSRLLFACALVVACQGGIPEGPHGELRGTWGGDNAGLIATDSMVHVHIGCTLGDVVGVIVPDAQGRFDAVGLYNVDAYPIDIGITHPARFFGQVRGRILQLTVALTDTTRQFGPVSLTWGVEPRMGPCPICANPTRIGDRSLAGHRRE